MNSDIRIAVSFLDHPKTVKLQRRRGDGAILCLIRLWCYVAENKPDGALAGMDAEDIEIAAKWGGTVGEFTAELVDLGFIESRDGIFLVHDWPEHNPYAYHAKDRQTRARAAAHAKHARSRPLAEPEHAGSIPGAGVKDAPSPVPSPSPSPVPSPTPPASKPDAATVWDVGISLLASAGLDEKSARSFIGRLIKTHGEPSVSTVLAQCSIKRPADPRGWITKALQATAKTDIYRKASA